MIFAIMFMIINRYACKLFKNIRSDVQTEGNGEIITSYHNYSEICNLILCMGKDLKYKF